MPRDGTKNLKPVRTKEEAKERGANGGKKSGETRRAQKSMREAAKLLLNMKPTESIRQTLDALGIEKSEQTNQMAILSKVLLNALKGDMEAAKFMRDTIGESPVQNRFEMTQVQETKVESPVNVYAVELPDNGRDKKKKETKKVNQKSAKKDT